MPDVREARESRKAPPDMKTGRSLRTCLSRGVPADHEAQSQVKEEDEAAAGVNALKGSLTEQKDGRKTRSDIAEFTNVGTASSAGRTKRPRSGACVSTHESTGCTTCGIG